jgi:prepilin-type N-terminal cleavage/methylation domain-containing protein
VLIMRSQRGFTLIELLISLVVLSIVTGSLFMLITTSQRVSRAQTERVTLQSNIRAGAIVLPSELRQVNAVVGGSVTQNDITSAIANPSSTITFRAMRGMSLVCEVPPVAGNQLRVYADGDIWTGLRDPAATDGAYVFLEGANADISSDDSWVQVSFTNAVKGNACPGAAASYTFTVSPAVGSLSTATLRAPVRTFEVMQMGLYASGGEYWLGARSVSAGEASMQPILGPLTSTGVEVNFYDGANALTTNVGNVKSITVTLRGLTDQPIVVGANTKTAYVQDTLVTRVALRNSLR